MGGSTGARKGWSLVLLNFFLPICRICDEAKRVPCASLCVRRTWQLWDPRVLGLCQLLTIRLSPCLLPTLTWALSPGYHHFPGMVQLRSYFVSFPSLSSFSRASYSFFHARCFHTHLLCLKGKPYRSTGWDTTSWMLWVTFLGWELRLLPFQLWVRRVCQGGDPAGTLFSRTGSKEWVPISVIFPGKH